MCCLRHLGGGPCPSRPARSLVRASCSILLACAWVAWGSGRIGWFESSGDPCTLEASTPPSSTSGKGWKLMEAEQQPTTTRLPEGTPRSTLQHSTQQVTRTRTQQTTRREFEAPDTHVKHKKHMRKCTLLNSLRFPKRSSENTDYRESSLLSSCSSRTHPCCWVCNFCIFCTWSSLQLGCSHLHACGCPTRYANQRRLPRKPLTTPVL